MNTDWFEERNYPIPILTEFKHDWRLRWLNDGDKELAITISKDLELNGYRVFDIVGSPNSKNVKMQMFVSKEKLNKNIHKIKKVCANELGIGVPSIQELEGEYRLIWKNDSDDLTYKIERLRKRYVIKDSYIDNVDGLVVVIYRITSCW